MGFKQFWQRLQRDLPGILLLAVTYLLAARLSIAALGLAGQVDKASPFWPPAGIALAVVLLYGRHFAIGVGLGALLVSASYSHQMTLWSIPHSFWLTAFLGCWGNIGQVWLGAELLRRTGLDPHLRQFKDLLTFLIWGVGVTPSVNAIWATLLSGVSGIVTPGQWLTHAWLLWLGDSMGILVMTPLILIWFVDTPRPQPGKPWRRWLLAKLFQPPQNLHQRPRWRLEACLWLGLLISVSWVVFGSTTGSSVAHYPLEYLPFPFVVWAALRLGLRGTVLCSFFISTIAATGAVQRGGPFITKTAGNIQEAIFLMQAFMAVISVTALVLAVAVAERRASELRLRHSEASLSKAQRLARMGNWDFDRVTNPLASSELTSTVPGSQLRWSQELFHLLRYDPETVRPALDLFLQRVHVADRISVQNALQAAIAQEQPYNLDYRLQFEDGTERIVHEQVAVDTLTITGTVQDITQRKRAEAALRESEKLRLTMYRYMSQDLAEQLLAQGTTKLGGERRFVSILFADIRGYTTLTERLKPEVTVEMLNHYFEAMVDVIFQHRGTLDKFIGDAIMAVFGSPISQTDHAQRAVLTALDMQKSLVKFNARRLHEQQPQIQIGIGINSDYVITGNIGSSKRMEFTAIGDGVNLSARLEGATKYYGCDLIISQNTYQLCADLVRARELDYICVKGKTQPVRIYELLGLKTDPIPETQSPLMATYQAGRQCFEAGHFTTARRHFEKALEYNPSDRPSQLQLERCRLVMEQPPQGSWDGSWSLD